MDIETLIKQVGSGAALAARLGVTPGAVSHWRVAGAVPPLRRFQIQALIDELVKAPAVATDAAPSPSAAAPEVAAPDAPKPKRGRPRRKSASSLVGLKGGFEPQTPQPAQKVANEALGVCAPTIEQQTDAAAAAFTRHLHGCPYCAGVEHMGWS